MSKAIESELDLGHTDPNTQNRAEMIRDQTPGISGISTAIHLSRIGSK